MCGFPTTCLEIQLLALVGLDVVVYKRTFLYCSVSNRSYVYSAMSVLGAPLPLYGKSATLTPAKYHRQGLKMVSLFRLFTPYLFFFTLTDLNINNKCSYILLCCHKVNGTINAEHG